MDLDLIVWVGVGLGGTCGSANVVFQQHSRKLLKMDILMPETY